MSSVPSRIIIEVTQIKFDYADSSHILFPEQAAGFVLGLRASADKASLQFKEVVACRSVTKRNKEANLNYYQSMWCGKGPFTSEQLLEMINFKKGISNKEWFQHMRNFDKMVVL